MGTFGGHASSTHVADTPALLKSIRTMCTTPALPSRTVVHRIASLQDAARSLMLAALTVAGGARERLGNAPRLSALPAVAAVSALRGGATRGRYAETLVEQIPCEEQGKLTLDVSRAFGRDIIRACHHPPGAG
jgi:hypothetical protein